VPFAVGDVVAGRYEVQASLGPRPLGVLYRAREREIGVEVALRVIGSNVLPDEAARAAFAQRLARARAFSHPHLVRVFGVYPTADDVVIATQWAPGQTIYERAQAQRFTLDEARPLVAQAAAAITHAHQHGVVLGDLHAATVVLLGQALKVSNVGIGPALPRKRFLEAVRESPGFQRLPPEVRNGLAADTRADVYSLAMLLVEMLTGGIERSAVVGPPPLAIVLGRALAEDPLVRHASVDALAHELEAVLSGQPIKRRPTPGVGTPLGSERSERLKLVETKKEDASSQVTQSDAPLEPKAPRSEDKTRAMDEDELALYKGDQITRVVPQEELFPLRVASSETYQFEREMIVEEEGADATRTADELALEAPPASEVEEIEPDEELRTSQVVLLEPDSAKTTQVPRLVDNNSPPPLDDEVAAPSPDDIDTQRVKKLPVEAGETATPLPPPSPASPTPPPPSPASAVPAPLTPALTPSEPLALADSPDAPTRVEVPEPKIEVRELPVETVEPAPLPTPTPLAAVAIDEPLYGRDEDDAPTQGDKAATMQSTPDPTAPPPRKRRNPFDPLPAEDELPTNEVAALPRRKRRNPFDPVPSEAAKSRPASGDSKIDGRKRRPAQTPATQLVPPIGGRRPTLSTIALVAAVAFVAAVGVALAVSRWQEAQRLEQERRDKQRMAEELNARAEELRRLQPPDAAVAATKPKTPVVTQPLDSVLPRAGACPLGAKLVTGGGRAFCVDAYEYPGGNTIPRVSVSFAEASHICAARGERLCGEGEWERACRGKGGASFPYGNSFDPTRCNTRGNSGEVAPAGTFNACRSAAGAYDMSGNVAEWVASGAQKGGSVLQTHKEARCSAVVRNASKEGSVYVGFRCCADPTPNKR
jgi:hypothetical protein